jgi:5TMR-LYT protein
MDSIFNEVCTLVTAAFALTLVPGFRRPERSLLSRRDQGTALLVFMILGLVEEASVSRSGLINERIVAVCAAGLVAGPWVGVAVGVFVTWLTVARHGLHCCLHVVRWLDRRITVALAAETGPTSANGVLPDFGNIVVAEQPSLLVRSSFARALLPRRGDRRYVFLAYPRQ